MTIAKIIDKVGELLKEISLLGNLDVKQQVKSSYYIIFKCCHCDCLVFCKERK